MPPADSLIADFIPNEYSVMIIGGPTASGKSALALEAAMRYDGKVINADAMQVYQKIPIITAVPTADDKSKAVHLLYEIYPPTQRGNVADWLNRAITAVRQCWNEHKLPIIVGGTGFYIDSLIKGVSPIPETRAEIKHRVAEIISSQGLAGAYEYLWQIDAVGAQKIRSQDVTRIRRALEIKLDTGKSIADWFKLPLIQQLPEADFSFIKLLPSLSELEVKCSQRFDIMIEQGAVDEVKELLSMGLDDSLPAMKAIGVPEIGAYLKGEITLPEAITLAKLHTRQYAKRQLTWFRHH